MAGRVVYITTKDAWDKLLEQAKSEKQTCIVDFYAQWCGPCKMIAPLFESLAKENPNMYFLKVDVDEVAAVAETCGITAMPTFHVFQNGVKVEDLVGASQDKLKALVMKYSDQSL